MAATDSHGTPNSASNDGGARASVARGAGMAFLGRSGAAIEAISQPVFTQLFGLATYGMFIALWSYGRIATMIADFAMTTALQRFGSGAASDAAAHAVLRLALTVSLGLACLLALATSLAAPWAAGLINVASADAPHLAAIIALYAWALPLWVFVEVATAAIRARHAFGPEIRVRIFYEQGSRLIFAVGFFLAGWQSYGLFAAHLASLGLAAALAFRLLLRHYNLKLLLTSQLTADHRREILGFCLAMMPANLAKRLFSDLPPLALNLMLAGAAGAQAAGLYGIARKIASIVQIVRQSFDYVMAPLTAASARIDWPKVRLMYGFATRVAALMVLPLAATIIALRVEIATIFGPGAIAGIGLIAALCAGRAVETLAGPAGAVLEVVGQRRLPLLTNWAGLALALALAAWLVPHWGPLGMAMAMAVGLNLSAWSSAWLLRRRHALTPFDRMFGRAILSGLAVSMLLLGAGLVVAPPWRLALLLALLGPSYWLAARLGLSTEDRAALRRKRRR
ncbi:MAG: hypothetical protein Tsb0016_03000 [Sphingomonadales bacterium]